MIKIKNKKDYSVRHFSSALTKAKKSWQDVSVNLSEHAPTIIETMT